MDTWLNAISNYGITVVGLVALATYFVYKEREHSKRIDALTLEFKDGILGVQNKYDEQIDKVVEALNNNTIIITKLYERLSKK